MPRNCVEMPRNCFDVNCVGMKSIGIARRGTVKMRIVIGLHCIGNERKCMALNNKAMAVHRDAVRSYGIAKL